jgi:hypothetical protein
MPNRAVATVSRQPKDLIAKPPPLDPNEIRGITYREVRHQRVVRLCNWYLFNRPYLRGYREDDRSFDAPHWRQTCLTAEDTCATWDKEIVPWDLSTEEGLAQAETYGSPLGFSFLFCFSFLFLLPFPCVDGDTVSPVEG